MVHILLRLHMHYEMLVTQAHGRAPMCSNMMIHASMVQHTKNKNMVLAGTCESHNVITYTIHVTNFQLTLIGADPVPESRRTHCDRQAPAMQSLMVSQGETHD